MARLARHGHLRAGLMAGAVLVATALGLAGGLARADYNNTLSTQEQRLYDYGPSGTNGTPKGTSILDSANPLDLMNKIRKGTAMDDATNPNDAIDAALKALEAQAPRPTAPTPGAAVKAP
ncbi:MAG: hypothetical protein ACKN83_08075 [Vulcanococcus sp.]